MIGKIVEINPRDSFYPDRESLIGTIWDVENENDHHPTYAGSELLEFTGSNGERLKFEVGESCTFYSVKFEILENNEVK